MLNDGWIIAALGRDETIGESVHQHFRRCYICPYRNALTLAEVEYAQLVDAVRVVSMFMSIPHAINGAGIVTQHLLAHVGRCVNDYARAALAYSLF